MVWGGTSLRLFGTAASVFLLSERSFEYVSESRKTEKKDIAARATT